MNVQAITELGAGTAPKTDPVNAVRPPPEKTQEVSQERAAAAEPAGEEDAQETDNEEVEQVLDGINTFLRSGENHIQFALHKEAKQLMVQVIDNHTQEIIRTFPPKEVLDLAAKIGEMVGTLIDQTG